MIKIFKTREVKTPARGTDLSAGVDFFIPEDFPTRKLFPGDNILIPAGIKVKIPRHHVLIAFNKSGIAAKKSLLVGACVIDEDYQGEIHINLINAGGEEQTLHPGDKVTQFVLLPVNYAEVYEANSLEELHPEATERGEGGFGSTGSK